LAVADDKKLKVIIFEHDQTILNRFKGLFNFKGHDVLSYSEPDTCPLLTDMQCDCPKDSPCADVLIADMQMGKMSGLEFFEHQRKKGCKTPDGNKLLLGEEITAEQQRAIKNLGCGFIKKPFNAYDVANWVERRATIIYEGSPTMH
jgi:FixJ family two-component response regulator